MLEENLTDATDKIVSLETQIDKNEYYILLHGIK